VTYGEANASWNALRAIRAMYGTIASTSVAVGSTYALIC